MKPFKISDYSNIMWEKNTWESIKKKADEGAIAVLPLGSIEQHGPMLPVECDAFLAKSWALEGAKRAKDLYGVKVIVCPTVTYGISTEHMDFPGTISLDLDTYIKLIENIVREIVRSGFKNIVCMSGHGGNVIPAKATLRELNRKFKNEKRKNIKLFFADASNCYVNADKASFGKIKQGQFNFHASANETSYYLFHRPELVNKKGLKKPKLKRDSLPCCAWATKDISESGASGDPSKAFPDHGKEIFNTFGNDLAAFLKKIDDGKY